MLKEKSMDKLYRAALITALLLFAGHTLFAADPPKMAAPNPQMQAVLDELAALKPKPIDVLDAKDARQQPTPTDAVKALLKKQDKPTAPQPVGDVDNRKAEGPDGKN